MSKQNYYSGTCSLAQYGEQNFCVHSLIDECAAPTLILRFLLKKIQSSEKQQQQRVSQSDKQVDAKNQ